MIGFTKDRPLTSYSSRLARPALSRTSLSDVPLPVAMLLLTMLLPGELDFYLGTLRLSFQRIVLATWFPIALSRLLGGKGSSLRSFDYLLIAAFTYYAFTLFLKESLDKAAVAGGSMLLEAVGGFLIARVYIRNQTQFLATIKLLFLLVMLLALMAIPESLLFSRIAKNFAASLMGLPPWPADESRLGLLRAMAVFDHPIHYGAFCAGVFGLVWFSEANLARRITRSSLVACAAFFSLSAAPLQGITFALTGALWERLTRHMAYRVWVSIAFVACLYSFAALLADRSPLKVFATSMVFDSGNAWYRVLIWDYGVENVLNSPWFGVPLGFWERPAWMPNDTLDNYWLAIALWGGLPSLVLYAFSIIALFRAVHKPLPGESAARRRCRYAWSATVLSLCLVGATVHYWGALGVYVVFCLGLGAWLADERNRIILDGGNERALADRGQYSRSK